ncbi:MAG: DUF4276 family protein [Cyanobacteria bacterium P01_E01_bin.42]
MQDGSIQLYVEAQKDVRLVSSLLLAAEYPLDRINFQVVKGIDKLKGFLSDLPEGIENSCAVLRNCRDTSVPDAVEKIKKKLGQPPVKVFCAIPEIEAWLFADEITAKKYAREQFGKEVIPTLPLPDKIQQPAVHAESVFGKFDKKRNSWSFLQYIDIKRASGRSPSLRYFLEGINQMFSVQPTSELRSVSRNISLDVFSGLIGEVIPSDTIIWKIANGDTFTALQLRQEIEQGTEIGQQYASDVLRVARDFLKRKAK